MRQRVYQTHFVVLVVSLCAGCVPVRYENPFDAAASVESALSVLIVSRLDENITGTPGRSWLPLNTSAEFGARTGGVLLTFDDRLWFIGGRSDRYSNVPLGGDEAWVSEDGIAWDRAASGLFTADGRADAGAVVFQGRMWLIGGDTVSVAVSSTGSFEASTSNTTSSESVWSSTDGRTWTNAAPGCSNCPIRPGRAFVWEDRLYFLSRSDGLNAYPVYMSDDGSTWTKSSTNIAELLTSPSEPADVFEFRGSLYALTKYWDVLRSGDGFDWELIHAGSSSAPETGDGLLFNDRMWVMLNGYAASRAYSSEDGAVFVPPPQSCCELPAAVDNVRAVVWNRRLWLTGTAGSGLSAVGQVYVSFNEVNP